MVLAPVVDVVTRPDNPSLGIRGFGDDPDSSPLVAAMVSGYQEAGVAATAKHFPGKGEAVVDPHDTLPVLDLDDDRLDAVEFAPFRAAAAAGVDLLMIGHYSVPVFTGDRVTPISASPVRRYVVRRRVGFGGVVISDAPPHGGLHRLRHQRLAGRRRHRRPAVHDRPGAGSGRAPSPSPTPTRPTMPPPPGGSPPCAGGWRRGGNPGWSG